jgi:hypothetical protein
LRRGAKIITSKCAAKASAKRAPPSIQQKRRHRKNFNPARRNALIKVERNVTLCFLLPDALLITRLEATRRSLGTGLEEATTGGLGIGLEGATTRSQGTRSVGMG